MTEMQLLIQERPSSADVLITWLPRLGFALLFFAVGAQKFASDSMWVRIFAAIGVGQWFRYFTGAMQIAGAAMLLIPRTAALGFITIGCTMAGAAAYWIVIAHLPFAAIIPGGILIAIVLFGWMPVSNALSHIHEP